MSYKSTAEGGFDISITGGIAYCTGDQTCETPPANCGSICADWEGTNPCYSGGPSYCYGTNFWTYSQTQDALSFPAPSAPTGNAWCPGTRQSRAAQFAINNTTGTCYLQRDLGTPASTLYFQFYVNPVSSSLGSGADGKIFGVSNEVPIIQLAFYVVNNGGTASFYAYYTNSTEEDTQFGNTVVAPLNKWYRIDGVLNSATSNSSIYYTNITDGGSRTAIGTGIQLNSSIRYVYFGKFATSGSAKTYTVQFDNIAFSTAGAPSACQ